MATKSMTGTILFKRASTDAIETYVGPTNEPVIDIRNDSYILRLMDGVTPGGHLIGAQLAGINTPAILTPVDKSNGITTSPLLTSSTFSGITHSKSSDTHVSTQWQVSTDELFSVMVYDSLWSTVNKTSIDLSVEGITLNSDTIYYCRIRHQGQSGLISDWSPVISFSTDLSLPLFQTGSILANDGVTGDDFGYSIDCSGDGSRIVVGAYLVDDNGSNSGAAYVYSRSGSNLVLEEKLLASDGAANDRFGNDVAISNDGNRIAVCAYKNDGTRGAIYIFTRSGSNWSQINKVVATNAGSWDQFGLSSDLSDDGNTLVVGATYEDTGGYNSGMIYVYEYQNGNWVETEQFTAPDAESNDQLGYSVSISGNGLRIAASTIRKGVNGNYIGAVYTYNKVGNNWYYGTKLTAPDGVSGDYFGYDIYLSVDGKRLVVSATGDDDNGTNSGSVYIFTENSGIWTNTKLTPGDGGEYDQFGYRVALSGDGNTLLIGSPFDDDKAEDAGAAYLYQYNSNTWNLITKYTAADGLATDALGQSLCISQNGGAVYLGSYRRNSYLGIVYVYS